MLIISPTEFNEATKLPVGLPIMSGGAFAGRIGFTVPIIGITTSGVVSPSTSMALGIDNRKSGRLGPSAALSRGAPLPHARHQDRIGIFGRQCPIDPRRL